MQLNYIKLFTPNLLLLEILLLFITIINNDISLVNGQKQLTTSQEQAALNKFRSIASKIVTHDYMETDSYLISFLKARDFNLERAAQMLKETMKYRKDNKIDTILQEDFSTFDENFKFLVPGVDKEGHPVTISLFGTYDLRKYVLAGKLRETLRFFDRIFELAQRDLIRRNELLEAERRSGNNVANNQKNLTDAVFIFDLAGFNLRKQACALCLTVIPHVFQNLESNYPGYLHRVFLINTPSIFLPIYETIKPFLSKSTAESVKIFGHNSDEWKSALLKEIDPDQLPKQFGGTKILDSLNTNWRTYNPEIAQLLVEPPRPPKN